MKSPIVYITIGEENISNLIADFEFEDSIEKDNLLKLQINPNNSLSFLNRKDITINSDLKFQFGYLQGLLSESHISKIADIHANYGQQGIRVSLVSLDVGTYLKNTSNKKIFINKTSSDIVKEIADKNGLKYELDKTTKIWKNLPQSNISDFKFLKSLAERENNYIFYIRGNTLFFKKRGLDKDSTLTFTYGQNIISFRPKQRMTANDGSSSKVKITSSNPFTGESTIVETDNTKSDDDILNSKKFDFNVISNVINETLSGDSVREKEIVTNTQDTEETENISKTLQQKENLKANEADLIVEGNPLLKTSDIITIKGVAQRHSGNWQIISVVHKINGSGFTSSLVIQTNGTNDGGNIEEDAASSKKNSTVGPDTKELATKVLKIFKVDELGGEILDEN